MKEEQTFKGSVEGTTRGSLPTWSLWNWLFGGSVATQSFKLNVSNPPAQREVEMRYRRVLGTVYDRAEVEVRGRMDDAGILTAAHVVDVETGAVVHAYRPPTPWLRIIGGSILLVASVFLFVAAVVLSRDNTTDNVILAGFGVITLVAGIRILRTPQQEGEYVLEGLVGEQISTRPEPARWGRRTLSVLNFKVDTSLPCDEENSPEDMGHKMVEMRSPWLRGRLFEGDCVKIFGSEEGEDNIVRSVRVKNTTTGATIRAYRPPWLGVLGPIFFIAAFLVLAAVIPVLAVALTGEPGFLAFLAISIPQIILGGAVSVIAGLILILRGGIFLVRRRPGGFELAIGAMLLVPMILAFIMILVFGLTLSDSEDIAALYFICSPVLGIVLLVAALLLNRRLFWGEPSMTIDIGGSSGQ